MCKATIYEARNNFSALVKKAENGEPVELTRHDKPVAVIISYDEFKKTNPKENFVEWLMKFREENKDILTDEGIPIPEDGYPDEKYITCK